MDTPIHPLTNDFVFKRILIDHPEELRRLLRLILGFSDTDLEGMVVANPGLEPSRPDGMRGILDLRVDLKDGRAVNLEMQSSPHDALRERILFYLSGMYSGIPRKGEGHKGCRSCASILIANFRETPDDCDGFHTTCMMYDRKRGLLFSPAMRADILELPKLPEHPDTELARVLTTFTLRTKEALMLHAQTYPDTSNLVSAVIKLNDDPEARLLAESRDKLERDIQQRCMDSNAKGREEKADETARIMLHKGMLHEIVAECLKLSLEDVRRIAGEEGLSANRPEDDPEARLLAESRDKLERDIQQRCMDSSEKGRAKGRLEGREEKAEEAARDMLHDGMPHELVSKYARISLERVRRIAEEEGLL